MKASKNAKLFIRYLLSTAINGHTIAVYGRPDGSIHLKHERFNKQSNIHRDFESEQALDDWLDRLDVNASTMRPDRVYNKGRLLCCALDDLGVTGFSEARK